MALSNTLTYDQTPPHRPGVDELGGAAFQNRADFPPDPSTQLTAEMWNQLTKLGPALAKVTPAVILDITNTGAPAIATCIAAGGNITSGDFDVNRVGAGDTLVTHTGGKLPPQTYRAFAQQVDDVEIDRIRVVPIANGWRVKTKLGATGTDCSFVLVISGL